MADCHSEPRALFLFQDSDPEPDYRVCSGHIPSHLEGQPCPFSDEGRMPALQDFPVICSYAPNGEPSSLRAASTCGLQFLGALEGWTKNRTLLFPKEFGEHDLYKCRQMFLLILIDPQSSII